MRASLLVVMATVGCVGSAEMSLSDPEGGGGGSAGGGSDANGGGAPSATGGGSGGGAGGANGGGAPSATGGGTTAANEAPAWVNLPTRFIFTLGAATTSDLSGNVTDGDGDALTFSKQGTWPAGVTFDAAARTLRYDGSGTATTASGLRLLADDGHGGTAFSPVFALQLSAAATGITVTYSLVHENEAGHDGVISWQSVFLLNDGRIASFGTGNHAPEQSNAVRIIDPVSDPNTVRYTELFPWTQDVSPPSMASGHNRWVSNYDNHPSIYLPTVNKLVWAGHGVFDIATSQWTHGNRPPSTQGWEDYVDIGDRPLMGAAYNAAVAWCAGAGVGVWFGVSAGGYGNESNSLVLISPSSGSHAWTLSHSNLGAQGVDGLAYARNTAVCIGSTLYLAGPTENGTGPRFYKIDVTQKRLLATLAPPPFVSGDYFPQLVHDTARNRLVLIGKRLSTYDFATDAWSDITPQGWRGYTQAMGVYHPQKDAIYFRGAPSNPTGISEGFDWHRITFQ